MSLQEDISFQNDQVLDNNKLVQEKQQKQKCQSGKQVKKIMSGAFQRHLREKFYQWRRNMDSKTKKQSGAESLIQGMDKRLKKLAFIKYLNKINSIKRELVCDDRVGWMRQKLQFKHKIKSFLAIQRFAKNHYSAKSQLKRLLRNLDYSLKSGMFKKWYLYRHENQKEGLSEAQCQTVSQIKERILESGHLQDKIESQNQQNKRSNNNLQQQAKRVIQNYFLRCHELSQKHYFTIWKIKCSQQSHLQLVLKKSITHWQRFGKDYMLRSWLKWQAEQKQILLTQSIMEEESSISTIITQTNKASNKYKNERDQSAVDIQRLKKQEVEYSQKHINCIGAIVKRRDSHFYMPKLQYMIKQWRQYTQTRKRCLNVFEKCLTKSLWQAGFAEIRHASRENSKSYTKDKGANKAIKIIYKMKVKSALKSWQSSLHQIITLEQSKIEKEIQKDIHKFGKVRDVLQMKLVDNKFSDKQSNILFECFYEWKAEILLKKQLKQATQQFNKQVSKSQKQLAIHKWQQRKVATKKLKQKCSNVASKIMGLNLKSIFQGWKEIFTREKKLCNGIKLIAKSADHFDLQDAMNQLKNQYYQSQSNRIRNQSIGVKQMITIFKNSQQQRLVKAFNQYRINALKQTKIYKTKRSVLIKCLMQKARSYLREWHYIAQKHEVIRKNHEEGATRLEIHTLNKDFQNLKHALRDEGIVDAEINQVLAEKKAKHAELVEKAVSRMYCYNNDLYLLPWCLDEWRKWVNTKKLFRKAIQLAINRRNYDKADLDHAFQRWKKQRQLQVESLQSKQKVDLELKCINNSDTLEKAARQIESQDYNREELTEQRDMLLKTYVGSQKLALSVINGHQERAKQKAISRLMQRNYDATQNELEQILQHNLDKIASMKARIKQLEVSNHSIADQNEELRIGALDGIDMAQNIEELSKEREKLSVDLADKAMIIRKLLEDNGNLSIRLANAQDEAEKLIKISQSRFQNSRY